MVEEANSVSRGTYNVVLTPQPGGGLPVTGTMTVEIKAQTKRLPDEAKKS